MRAFADDAQGHDLSAAQGAGHGASVSPLDAESLYYTLPEFGLKMQFRPIDFTQVNHGINRMLLRRAMYLLNPQPGAAHCRHVLWPGQLHAADRTQWRDGSGRGGRR